MLHHTLVWWLKYVFGMGIIILISIKVAYSEEDSDRYTGGSKRPKSLTQSIDDSLKLISTKKIQYDKPRIVATFVFPRLVNVAEDEDDEEADAEREIVRKKVVTKTASDTQDPYTINESNEGADTTTIFNHLVSDLLQSSLDDFKKVVEEKQTAQGSTTSKKLTNRLYVDYDTSIVKAKKNRIVSLRFTIHGRVPGLRGVYSSHKVLNYNIDSGQVIELADLFQAKSAYLNMVALYCNEYLSDRLPTKNLIDNGTTPTIEHYKNWNIKGNGLLITFDESQVAPSALGTQTVFIPYRSLEDVLSLTAPLGDCIKNNKRCRRNNILSGGFIDEVDNRKVNPLQFALKSKPSGRVATN